MALGSGVAPERNATVIAVGGDSKSWSTPVQAIGNGQYGGENPNILEPMETWYQGQPSLRVSLDSDQQPVVPGTQVTKSGAPLTVNGIDYTNFNEVRVLRALHRLISDSVDRLVQTHEPDIRENINSAFPLTADHGSKSTSAARVLADPTPGSINSYKRVILQYP